MNDDPPAISFGEAIPEEVLRDRFGMVSAVPPLAPELSFRLALPRDWGQVADIPMSPLNPETFSMAAAFKASDEVSVQVLAALVPWEVDLVDWLHLKAEAHQFKLLNIAEGGTEYGQAVHAVAQAADAAHLRLVAMGNGPSVVLCLGRMPEGAPESVRETLGVAAASFAFTEPCWQQTREPVTLYTDRETMFRFLHPESWSFETLDALRPAKAAANFRITGETDTLAYLRVQADTRYPRDEEGLRQILQLMTEEISDAGVVVHELKAMCEKEGALEQWLGECQLGANTVHIAILLRPAASSWLGALMLCPKRDADPWSWMRGKRAYELAVATLETCE